MDNKRDSEQFAFVNGKTIKIENTEEERARIAAAKAELDKQLSEGLITGAEYNQKLIELRVPEKEKPRPKKAKKINALIPIVFIIIVAAIPEIIHLNWRFFFQNSLLTEGVPNYSDTMTSTINNEPIQINLEGYSETGTYRGRSIRITYKAYYDITGMVTSVRNYWGFSAYDALVPRDVCMVWGNLVDTYKNHEVDFSQGKRNCKPKINGVDIDDLDVSVVKGKFGNDMLALHEFSNNHLIPSTPEIKNQILGLNKNDIVRITGYLVSVDYDGIWLSSSMSRSDYGDHACEVFYVTKIEK